ncbi:protein ALP1-like [Maniola jurtina]|uniref:protein ALP1-like n=1 Tax=Maniola jurtina TaxID=191418 RepID=UPI001E68ED85|nr:protein ALP1-like [Maniola jurtina]
MEERLLLLSLLWLLLIRRRRRHQRIRRNRIYWVHPLLENKSQSQFRTDYPKLRRFKKKFYKKFRMNKHTFDYLLNELNSELQKKDTAMRKSIPSVERLAMTLRYLATGCSFEDLADFFKCGTSTASKIVHDVCRLIWDKLQPIHLPTCNKTMWLDIANKFKKKANFPNCLGAVDGKHIRIIHPPRSGSLFFNYKHFFSIVLMAVCDADYLFVYVDVGAYGKTSDSTIWRDCSLYDAMERNDLDLPGPQAITPVGRPLPMVFIGDEAFGLHKHLLRPYSGKQLTMKKRVFNYRLSRARRYVECSFGILTNKWRILHRPIMCQLNLQQT